MNTCGELELYHAQNQAEPENHAGLAPGPDPDPKKKFQFFFLKIKSGTMPDHHVKGQHAASTYVREKGGVTCDTICVTPCSLLSFSTGTQIMIGQFWLVYIVGLYCTHRV